LHATAVTNIETSAQAAEALKSIAGAFASLIFTVAVATLIGVGLNFTPINPIKALYWSAVINGVVAVPVMVILMLMTAERRIMGEFTVKGWLCALGWISTAAMTACVVGMFATWLV
jgi:Mn2+/Fe2+ NRAMP family transporter